MLKTPFGALAALILSLAPVPAAAQDADPALWVIRDKDTTIYLFGTMHAMKPGLSWFDEAVKTAFDASGELVLEVAEPEPAELRALVMRLAVSADGKPLTGKLPEARRADLARTLAGYGMPANALDRFDPWFAAPILARILALWSAGEADALGALMNQEMARTPALAKRMIADRNARWTDWIAARMARPGTVFFAVGGGHLGGKGNVRELLAGRRIKVERVGY